MDIDFWYFIIPASFVFLAMVFRVTTWSKRKFNSNLNLPPGPKKLPLIGNLHQLLASFQPTHRILSDLALKYGPMMHLQLGEISTIVISSPDAAKEVLKMHDITFANRPSFLATEILFYKNSDIAFSPYGEYWRQLRKICTLELLSARRVQSFQPLRQEEFLNLCGWIASKEGSLVNLTEKLHLTTCYIVMQASLGNKIDELETFISIFKETEALIDGFYMADLYPSIKLFRVFSIARGRAERLHKISDRILESIIKNHKQATDEGKLHEDFVDVLLKFNEPGQELYLTSENIKAVLRDMFNAGIGTSVTVVEWAMAEMLKNPRVLEKAQDEVRHVFKDKGFVDESNFDELKYLKLVIKETLRMHPPAPLLIPRLNSERCEIHGYEVPAQTRVMVNVWAIGRDPKHWKEAERFIPERYQDMTVDYKGNNFEYLPFGGGRRICPGMSFGLANAELPLAMFLYHFDWVLPHGTKSENVDMTETFGLTARRKMPLCVIPVVKNPVLAMLQNKMER